MLVRPSSGVPYSYEYCDVIEDDGGWMEGPAPRQGQAALFLIDGLGS